MNDESANRIVFLFLLIITVLLLFTIIIILKSIRIFNNIKNNDGNFGGIKIVLFLVFIVVIFGLVSWWLQSKKSDRKSLSRSEKKDSE